MDSSARLVGRLKGGALLALSVTLQLSHSLMTLSTVVESDTPVLITFFAVSSLLSKRSSTTLSFSFIIRAMSARHEQAVVEIHHQALIAQEMSDRPHCPTLSHRP
ncbi:hypothetical protein ACLBKS_04300 [Hylemonella sp. W303a]|uniref:hypothetical protein n=1 Tax=Hylemonella sp. W303a TaxID=3389873 RepID=UPI00396B4521